MPAALAEVIAVLALAVTIAFALARPRGWPELAVAAPAAALVVATGIVSPRGALDELSRLGPTVGFLAAVLVLGEMCEREGLFAAAGRWMASASRGRPVGLLALVFAVAAATTVALSLDATVVLLTPAVLATATTLHVRRRPHLYACAHLANSASLLLPVSNLTNLIALRASGLSFFRFGALMALPWLAVIAVEWVVLRRFFAADLAGARRPAPDAAPPGAAHVAGVASAPRAPRAAIAVLALTLAGFAIASAAGAAPVFAAAAGATALAALALVRRRATPGDIARSVGVPFLVFVLALGIVVRGAEVHGLGRAADALMPGGASLGALLAVAAVAAVLANVVNNLPAILILLPATAAAGPGPVLAALIGVNVGPNLTYIGSLATLLWRRTLRRHGVTPSAGTFVRLGAATVPAALAIATVLLWVGLRGWG